MTIGRWKHSRLWFKDIYEVHTVSFQTFFVWVLLLIVHTWNSSPLLSNLLRLQCTCFTVPTSSARPHGSPLVWECQWPSSQHLSSPQLSHNNSQMGKWCVGGGVTEKGRDIWWRRKRLKVKKEKEGLTDFNGMSTHLR